MTCPSGMNDPVRGGYLLFGSSCYYPEGGAHDFLGSYASIEEAEQQWITWINDPEWRTHNGMVSADGVWAHVARFDAGDVRIVSQRVRDETGAPQWYRLGEREAK